MTRFHIFDRMDKDTKSLCKFKQKSINILFGESTSHNHLTIVAVVYSGKICVLDSSDPKMQHVLHSLISKGGPYYVWLSFDKKDEALEYKWQLKSIDISLYISKDRKKVKVDW